MSVPPLPCPFCGSTDVSVKEGTTFRWRAVECQECGARSGEVRVSTVGHPDQAADEAAAIKEWNKRA